MKKLLIVCLSVLMVFGMIHYQPVRAINDSQALITEDNEEMYWQREETYFVCINYDRNVYSDGSAHHTTAEKVNTKRAIKNKFFRLALQACIDKDYFNSDIYDYNYTGACLSRNMLNPTNAFELPSGKMYSQLVEDYVNASNVFPYYVNLTDRQDAFSGGSNFRYFKNLAAADGTFTFPVTLDLATLSEECDLETYEKSFQFKTMVQEISEGNILINLIEYNNVDDYWDQTYFSMGDTDIAYTVIWGMVEFSPSAHVRYNFGHNGQSLDYMNLTSADIRDEIGYIDYEYYAEAGASYAAQYPSDIETIYDRYAEAEAYFIENCFAIPYRCAASYYPEGIISYYDEFNIDMGDCNEIRYYTAVSNDINDWTRTYTVADPSIAYVDPDGNVYGLETGVTEVKISVESGDYVKVLIRVGNAKSGRRIYGPDRYSTSFAVADEMKKVQGVYKFSIAVVARGDSFADALAGSSLAVRYGAPILLTDGKESRIKKLVKYLTQNMHKGGTIYLLGGEAAVPAEVESRLTSEGFKVKRISGDTRYTTNIFILQEAGIFNGDEILVCSANNYADALAASGTGLPILLVDTKLKASQKKFLQMYSDLTFTIIGGTAAVSAQVESELKAYGSVKRIEGSSRYETSQFIAEYFNIDATAAVIAYGKSFPDGLCAGPLAYALGAPILLATSGQIKNAKNFIADYHAYNLFVIGGQNCIDDAAFRKIGGLPSNYKIIEIQH